MNAKESVDKFKEHIRSAIAIATDYRWGDIQEEDSWWEECCSTNDLLNAIYTHVDYHLIEHIEKQDEEERERKQEIKEDFLIIASKFNKNSAYLEKVISKLIEVESFRGRWDLHASRGLENIKYFVEKILKEAEEHKDNE